MVAVWFWVVFGVLGVWFGCGRGFGGEGVDMLVEVLEDFLVEVMVGRRVVRWDDFILVWAWERARDGVVVRADGLGGVGRCGGRWLEVCSVSVDDVGFLVSCGVWNGHLGRIVPVERAGGLGALVGEVRSGRFEFRFEWCDVNWPGDVVSLVRFYGMACGGE